MIEVNRIDELHAAAGTVITDDWDMSVVREGERHQARNMNTAEEVGEKVPIHFVRLRVGSKVG